MVCSYKKNNVEIDLISSLRWLGHVLRKDNNESIKQVWDFKVEGNRGRGKI